MSNKYRYTNKIISNRTTLIIQFNHLLIGKQIISVKAKDGSESKPYIMYQFEKTEVL